MGPLSQAVVLSREGRHADAIAVAEGALQRTRDRPLDVPFIERVQLVVELSEFYVAADERGRAQDLLTVEAAHAERMWELAQRDGSRDKMQTALAGRRMLLDCAAQTSLVGHIAPEINVADWVQGRPTMLSELRGRVVLLEFWAPSCRPCMSTFSTLVDLHSRYRQSGLEILALTRYVAVPNSDANAERSRQRSLISTVIDGRGIEFRVGIAENEQVQQKYGALGMPSFALIDRLGVVRSSPSALDKVELERAIVDLLNDSKTPAEAARSRHSQPNAMTT